jgi:hypothetical protein
MLTIVPKLLPNGVVSVLVTFTEVSPPDPGTAGEVPTSSLQSTLDGTTAPQGNHAVHCGAAMQLVTPAVGGGSASYTFAPSDACGIELPPVWRCACGFQLDAWTPWEVRSGHLPAVLAA